LIGNWNIIAASSPSNLQVNSTKVSSKSLIFDESCKGTFSYLNINYSFTLGKVQSDPNSISFICEDLTNLEIGQALIQLNDKSLRGTINQGKYTLTFQAVRPTTPTNIEEIDDSFIIIEDEEIISNELTDDAPINIES